MVICWSLNRIHLKNMHCLHTNALLDFSFERTRRTEKKTNNNKRRESDDDSNMMKYDCKHIRTKHYNLVSS